MWILKSSPIKWNLPTSFSSWKMHKLQMAKILTFWIQFQLLKCFTTSKELISQLKCLHSEKSKNTIPKLLVRKNIKNKLKLLDMSIKVSSANMPIVMPSSKIRLPLKQKLSITDKMFLWDLLKFTQSLLKIWFDILIEE